MTTTNIKTKKRFQGVVISDKMDKTVVVSVRRYVAHPKYKKYINKSKNYKAHDETNIYKEGDIVMIEETRPLSKSKNFKVVSRTAMTKKAETSE